MRRPGAARTTETRTMEPQRESYHHGDLSKALRGAALELVRERRSTHFSLRDLAERVASRSRRSIGTSTISTICSPLYAAKASTRSPKPRDKLWPTALIPRSGCGPWSVCISNLLNSRLRLCVPKTLSGFIR